MPTLQPGGFLLGAGQVPIQFSRYTQGLVRAPARVTRSSPSPPSGRSVVFLSRPGYSIPQGRPDVNTFSCKEMVKFYEGFEGVLPPCRDPEAEHLGELPGEPQGEPPAPRGGRASGSRPPRGPLQGLGAKILPTSGPLTFDIFNKI